MNLNQLIKDLFEEEGFRSKPYEDTTGHLTIGVGRNLKDVGISEDEARFLLVNDIKKAIGEVNEHLPWFGSLDEVRQRVLVDMCFNMGWGDGRHGLSTFPNMLEHVRAGKFPDAAEHMLASTWAKQVGKRATKLAKMMETGMDVA